MRFAFVFALGVLVFSQGCDKASDEAQMPIKAVKIQEMDTKSSGQQRVISGIVKTENRSDIGFRVHGRIEKLLVDVGDSVLKDQPLAILDKKDLELNVLSAKATLESARADLKEKTDEYNRFKKLKQQNYVSEAELEKMKTHWQTAQSQVQVSETKLADAELNLSRTTLVAPFSGKIAKRYFEPFMQVQAGQPVYEVQGQSYLQVEALIPETLIHEVQLGDELDVSFPTLKNIQLKGKIAQIGTDVQSGNAFLIKVSLKENFEQLRPGMTAVLRLELFKNQKPTFKLPLSALDFKHSENKKEVSIYVFDAVKQVAQRRKIEVGDVVGNEVEVKQGLSQGEQVIVAGVPFIQDGQRVKKWVPKYNNQQGGV